MIFDGTGISGTEGSWVPHPYLFPEFLHLPVQQNWVVTLLVDSRGSVHVTCLHMTISNLFVSPLTAKASGSKSEVLYISRLPPRLEAKHGHMGCRKRVSLCCGDFFIHEGIAASPRALHRGDTLQDEGSRVLFGWQVERLSGRRLP